MVLETFHPAVRTWFQRRFGTPTDVQSDGWPAIASGNHTLIAAPTGSGKTLAAFLISLDKLIQLGLENGLPDATQIVYVSPLKALANDIQRNLIQPLEEIRVIAEEIGAPCPEIRVAVRTGDTTQKERALHVRRPPHVLITTPESLFILLTSERGRQALKSTHTLILDELHAVAPNKRGSHLSLSVERLCHLAEQPVIRIGLSATQKPIEEMGRFLTGGGSRNEQVDCAIVNTGHRRAMDLAVVLPREMELGPIASNEQWADVLDQITELVRRHRTTLVFVNTRRLVERVAHLLSDRLGEGMVAAHHGSLSKEARFYTEQRLKTGELKVCVATASLELGIDVGDVDLVCQIASPRNIGVALQRVGRSGHFLRGMPKGRFFPLTRDELVETAALFRAIKAGELDALTIPAWPLDVLAQQIVASCATEEWDEDDLYGLITRSYSYRELPRKRYDAVIKVLADGVASRWGRGAAHLHRDGVHNKVKARRGSRIIALTNGGAIPDTADYLVVAEPEGAIVGTVNEDFAIESMSGDVFLLGNTPWKIRRVESGSIRVEEAHGQSPTIPFWLGEALGRTLELSREVSTLRRDVELRLHDEEKAIACMMEADVSREAAGQIVAYIREGRRVLGMVPTMDKLVAERFFDEAGGMQLVIHSPWGSRLNRAWGLALRKRFCAGFNFELQAAATDEGINISLGPQHSFPLEEVFSYLKSATASDVLLQAVFQSPIFPLRWRWTASRSLALLRQVRGKRVPTPIQRMRSDDLMGAVFPAAVACQDNMPPGGTIVPPDHPLVFETIRDCLTEALDAEGMQALLGKIERGEVEVFGRDTVQPSVFSHQILNANPYAFLDDAPLEERRARAVALRRALPDDSTDLGDLSPATIAEEEALAWPAIRDADELHDALLSLVVLADWDLSLHPFDSGSWMGFYEELASAGRAFSLEIGSRRFWYAAERAEIIGKAYGQEGDSLEGIVEILRGRTESTGPFTLASFAGLLSLDEASINHAVITLEAEGLVLRGRFTPGSLNEEFCDRRILARIHRRTIGRLRREIEPVPVASFVRFLLEWQHLAHGTRLQGESGLVEVVEQLQGFEAAAAAWETDLLPSRLNDFRSSTLDALSYGGDLTWGRFSRRGGPPSVTGLSRNGPIALAVREELPWLLDAFDSPMALSGAAADVFEFLEKNGASFVPDIVLGTKRLPSEVDDALWLLVAAGQVTADGFGALRGLVGGRSTRARRRSLVRPRIRSRTSFGQAGSRWSVLRRVAVESDVEVDEMRAMQLLRRYGIIMRELLSREPMAPPWSQLVRVLRRAEARGQVRGGRFVAGLLGEQFALPEAVDGLRAIHRRERTGEIVRVAATDPLNLVGIITPGQRVPAVLGNEIFYRDGTPVESIQSIAMTAS